MSGGDLVLVRESAEDLFPADPVLGELAPAQAHTRPPQINLAEYRIRRKQVLGGLTHEYQVAA